MTQTAANRKLPIPFIVRRLHSLMGLWLVIYITEHLWVNAQAAFLFKDQGASFIRYVNRIHALPWIHGIEITLLALPFFIHAVWGVRYLFTGKYSSFPSSEAAPYLPYGRNRAYTWQRLTAWILVIGVIAHVIQMRFIHYPHETDQKYFQVEITADNKLPFLLNQLHARTEPSSAALTYVLAETPTIGSAFLLVVRDTFKHLWMVILYSLFVIAATYHAFNGLWTFCITWGITITQQAQKWMRLISILLMVSTTILGLGAIWGLYISFELMG